MRTSQIAAAVLVGVFLVASVVLLLFGKSDTAIGFAQAFAVMAMVGLAGLVVLIFYEARR